MAGVHVRVLNQVFIFLFSLSIHLTLTSALNVTALPSQYVGLGLGTVINLTDSATTTRIEVLSTDFYVMSLESKPSKITIRTKQPTSPDPSVGELVWVANFYNKSVNVSADHGVTISTLKLGEDGDLQLLVSGTISKNQTLVWNSGTAGKGVQLMNISSDGNLMLLDATNQTIWESSQHPNLASIDHQKFRYYD